MKVLIVVPDLSLAFKRPKGVALQPSPTTFNARLEWARFVDEVAQAFEGAGHTVRILECAGWEITPDLIDLYGADVAFVPHKTRRTFDAQTPCLFWMQMYCRHLFTVDPEGWGAEASVYPVDYSAGDAQSDAFDTLKARLVDGRDSKLGQPEDTPHDLLSSVYIFHPCQLPHDENVVQHSYIGEEDLCAALWTWCVQNRVHLVLKGHPANPDKMAPLRRAAPEDEFVHWIDGNIHDLIAGAMAVYTINSGVGFEALLHGKRVVTFGRCEYDAVATFRCEALTMPDLADADAAVRYGADAMATAYPRFVDWFTRHYAVDIDDTDRLPARMERLIAQAETVAEQRAAA